MARNNSQVLLGFEDEVVTEKYKDQLNFTVNKIGGQPVWPYTFKPDPPLLCPLCQLPRPLVVQIYAPLEISGIHRILYLFACINPNCCSLSESWLCVRVQTVEKIEETNASAVKTPTTTWCVMENDWGDDEANTNLTEENGNIISETEKISDEEESCSFEDSLRNNFGNLTVDEKNANNGAYGVAAGKQDSLFATAEIEGNEGEVISIDTPTMPQVDLVTLLQEVPPLPQEICSEYKRKNATIQFVPYFMNVYEESFSNNSLNISDRHVKELLANYQQKNDNVGGEPDDGGAGGGLEKYEKSRPAHGDKMFHHFLSKIQSNPGQILRYSREDEPLLLQPLTSDIPKKCPYCQSEMVFEFQIISTIIPKLKLVSDVKQCSRLEFGTVLVYTCKKSCWSSDTDFRLETVLPQNESY